MFFIRTFFNFGFIFFIFPFIAKRLNAENLGKIQYVEAIVAYFLLFINLGINTYGKREIAHFRDNKEKISKITCELLFILSVTTFLSSIVYIFFVEKFVAEIPLKKIFYIYFFNILLNFLGVEWFYEGIENQEYITKRNIFFKIISIFLILCFIRTEKDVYRYVWIYVFGLVGANILNFINLRKYINFYKVSVTDVKKHLKPIIVLFSTALALSVSYYLDSIMIKIFKSDIELGYYSFAMRFAKMPLIFSSAISAIFYPRICNFINKKDKKEYLDLLTKGIELILIYSLPAFIGMYLISDLIVEVFGGSQYKEAIVLMQIFSISILINGIALCTGSLTLVANKRDKVYMISIFIGSLLNFIFNLIFIPKIGAKGAAAATLLTEIVAIIIRILFAKDLFKEIKIVDKNLMKIVISTFAMSLGVILIRKISLNNVLSLIITVFSGGIIYLIFLLILKEKNLLMGIGVLKNKWIKRRSCE